MYSSYQAPVREFKYLDDFGRFLCCWLATSSPRKHLVSRFWMPTTTAVGRTRRRHTPHQERPWISRAAIACKEGCSYPQVRCKRSVEDCFFFVSLRMPKFRPLSTAATPQSRVVGFCWEPAGGHSQENHKLFGWNTHPIQPISARHELAKGANTAG